MNLDLGGTIWLNVSRKLLSYHKWFFVPFNEMPKHVFEEFKRHKHTHSPVKIKTSVDAHSHKAKMEGEHHSHTHPNWSGSTSSDSHTHSGLTGDTKCGKAGATPHGHFVYFQAANAHSHTVTLAFGAANLGSPWYNHVHSITLVTMGSAGGAHTHTPEGLSSRDGCDLEVAGEFPCLDNPHNHGTSQLTIGSAGAVHTHTLPTVNTDYAISTDTPENHRHNFSFYTNDGDSHTHTVSGSIITNYCWGGFLHTHTPPSSVSGSHRHSISGTTGYGGEPLPTVAKKPLMDGFVYVE
jgi:hypothetical protein